jgi:hypothetical protein
MTSNGTTSQATDAPVADGVYRDGKQMVVRRGADVSSWCAKCGRPAAGAAYVRRLGEFGGSGGALEGGGDLGDGIFAIIVLVIYLFVFVFWLLSLLVALAERRQRVVLVGLCDEHQRLRRTMRWVGIVGWLTVPVAVAAIVLVLARPPRATAAFVTIIVAGALAALAGLIVGVVGRGYPSLRLVREDKAKSWMWVSGFSPALLADRPAWPRPPTLPKPAGKATSAPAGRPSRSS